MHKPHRPRTAWPSNRRARAPAFTLVELLIVIGIIAVLISILVPVLGKARVQTRRVMCMANQRSLAQAVQTFATEHHGFGQLIAYDEWRRLYRYLPGRFDYEHRANSSDAAVGSGGVGWRPLTPWPIAYADYIGAPGLRSEELFLSRVDYAKIQGPRDMNRVKEVQEAVRAKRKVDVLQCPADRELVGFVRAAYGSDAAISYSINLDLFGEGPADSFDTNLPDGSESHLVRRIWRNGGMHGFPLGGRLERVDDPAGVLMFVDGGGIESRQGQEAGPFPRVLEFASAFGPRFSSFNAGARPVGFPRHRHSPNGGLVGVHVDGHADYLRPVKWRMSNGERIPIHYAPNPRVSPYALGPIKDMEVERVTQRR